MQHDDLIWSIIRGACSHRMATSRVTVFCRNKYNVTGMCNKTSCPLSNSQYATVREDNDKLYLYLKVVERAAFPGKLWERVPLKPKVKDSLELINAHLAYWNPFQIHKVKLRFIRLKQVLNRKKKLAKKEPEVHLEPLKKKHEKREKKREYKALIAAKMEKTVERELKDRLQKGVYGELYNFNNKLLEEEDEEVSEEEEEEDIEIVEDDTIMESEDEIEDIPLRNKVPSRKRARIEMEYETEKEPEPRKLKSTIKINT